QPHHIGSALHAQCVRHLGTTDQVFGEYVIVGDEPAQVYDPPDACILRRICDIGSGEIVSVAEVRLADAVHKVVEDIDRTGVGERLLGRGFIVRVQHYSGDLVMPAEVGQSVRISGAGNDIVACVEQRADEP